MTPPSPELAGKGGGLIASHPVLTTLIAIGLVAGLSGGGVALSRHSRTTSSSQVAATQTKAAPTPSFLDVERAMCARLGTTDSQGDHCAMKRDEGVND